MYMNWALQWDNSVVTQSLSRSAMDSRKYSIKSSEHFCVDKNVLAMRAITLTRSVMMAKRGLGEAGV